MIDSQEFRDSKLLRLEIKQWLARLDSGEWSVDQFAGAVTHLNFDPRFTEDLVAFDDDLSHIIEDLAPDMEFEKRPDFLLEIRKLLHTSGN